MNKIFTVTDLPTADDIKYIWLRQGNAIVSLIDPDLCRTSTSDKHLIVSFHDLWSQNTTLEKPTEHHVTKIVDFVKNTESLDILVHCHAGISRSTAVAIGLEILFNGCSFQQAFDKVNEQRKTMWPNQLIIKHFEKLYPKDCSGLFEFLKIWRGKQIAEIH